LSKQVVVVEIGVVVMGRVDEAVAVDEVEGEVCYFELLR
jgi:hypothetical protein